MMSKLHKKKFCIIYSYKLKQSENSMLTFLILLCINLDYSFWAVVVNNNKL